MGLTHTSLGKDAPFSPEEAVAVLEELAKAGVNVNEEWITCSGCDGSGHLFGNTCDVCGGTGGSFPSEPLEGDE